MAVANSTSAALYSPDDEFATVKPAAAVGPPASTTGLPFADDPAELQAFSPSEPATIKTVAASLVKDLSTQRIEWSFALAGPERLDAAGGKLEVAAVGAARPERGLPDLTPA
jgi:hypothetical protein